MLLYISENFECIFWIKKKFWKIPEASKNILDIFKIIQKIIEKY